MNSTFLAWLAEGLGVGRIPFGPGTFGSLLGLLWFALLLAANQAIVFSIGVILSIPFSVLVCGAAEKILKKKDPSSVVMDEIVAIPLCFVSWLCILYFQKDFWPTAEYFFFQNWPMTLAVFVFFRIFDIAKPWPVRQSQKLTGGWGVTADDVLAAVYVNLVVGLIWLIKPGWF